MRDAARKMEEKHFSDRTTEHVEFLPVEWRSKLCLDGGMFYNTFVFNCSQAYYAVFLSAIRLVKSLLTTLYIKLTQSFIF